MNQKSALGRGKINKQTKQRIESIGRKDDEHFFFCKFPCTKYHLARPYLDTQFLNYLSLDIQRIDSIGTSVFQVCTKLRSENIASVHKVLSRLVPCLQFGFISA